MNMSQHRGHSQLANPAMIAMQSEMECSLCVDSLSYCLLNCLCLLICNCLFRILFVFVKIKHSQLANPAISVKVESSRTTLGEPWNTSRPGSRLLKNIFFSLSLIVSSKECYALTSLSGWKDWAFISLKTLDSQHCQIILSQSLFL